MKSHLVASSVGPFVVLAGLAWTSAMHGQSTNLINDGTTIDRLVLLQNQAGLGTPPAGLSAVAQDGQIQASQSADYSDFPVNGTWYDSRSQATGDRLQIQADVRPAGPYPEYVLGVMGWLDVGAGHGIVSRLVPGSPARLQLGTIDFAASTWEDNDSLLALHNLDGTPASATLGSAWAELTAYDPSLPATIRLEFAPPAPAELVALTNATAHVRAHIQQGGVELASPVELLTTLPRPAPHRFGYHASWGTSLFPGELIGYLDNLVVVGDLEIESEPPILGNAQAAPSNLDFQEFRFRATGMSGGKYRIDTSVDLLTWQPAQTGVVTSPIMDFTLPRASTGNAWYFRVAAGVP